MSKTFLLFPVPVGGVRVLQKTQLQQNGEPRQPSLIYSMTNLTHQFPHLLLKRESKQSNKCHYLLDILSLMWLH